MNRLEGRTALVTGSGRNIGRAIALKLAREGANLVVNARSNQEEAESVAEEVRGPWERPGSGGAGDAGRRCRPRAG